MSHSTQPSRRRLLTDALLCRGLWQGLYRSYAQSLGLRGDDRVLEIGPGSGALSRFLAGQLTRGGSLLCVDVSVPWQRVWRRTMRRFRNVEYRLGALPNLDLPPASLDAVVIHFMLHDVQPGERAALLAAATGTLRPGGKLFLREPTREGHGLKPEQVRELMASAGLREIAAETVHLSLRGASLVRSPLRGPAFAAVYEKP